MTGELEEDVVERRPAERDVVDLDPGCAELLDDLDQVCGAAVGGDRDPPRVLLGRRGPIRRDQLRGAGELGGVVCDDLDPLAADLRLQLVCRTARDDPPLVDDRDLVRELVGLLEVLGGEEERRALAHLGPDHVPHAESAARVEPGRRLVEEENARPAGQRRREVEPPAHPARVGLGDPVCGVPELEALEQLVGARAGLLFREVVEPSEHPEVLASGQVLVHGRVLAGEADRLAHRLRFADDVEARHACAAGIRLQQRREDADGRRLAGPIRPEQPENGAFLHLEVDAVEGAHLTLARAVDLDESLCFDGGHAC